MKPFLKGSRIEAALTIEKVISRNLIEAEQNIVNVIQTAAFIRNSCIARASFVIVIH